MQRTFSVVSHSGHVVAFDPAAVVLRGRSPDLEALEAGSSDGSVLWSTALDDETLVRVLVDEPMPGSLAAVASREVAIDLRIPSGHLWIADPAYLHTRDRPVTVPIDAGQRLDVISGDYRATAYMLDWPSSTIDTKLRRAAGTLPVATRDILGIGTILLGAMTVIGLPVFLVGRVLDDGLAGAVEALAIGLALLAPLWLVIAIAWRLPAVRRVDRVDEEISRQHPDLVLVLRRHSRHSEQKET